MSCAASDFELRARRGMGRPAFSTGVLDELVRVVDENPMVRRAELATALRFAAAATLAGPGGVDAGLEAQLTSGVVADRLRHEIKVLYGIVAELDEPSLVQIDAPYVLRIRDRAPELVRRTRLADSGGRWVRGLPPPVVAGSPPMLAAAWRAAVFTATRLSRHGDASGLEIVCPTVETAIALAGAARRLGVAAGTRASAAGECTVIPRDDDARRLLRTIGAPLAARGWRSRPVRVRSGGRPGPDSFDDANRRRRSEAATRACARVARALDILGGSAPRSLVEVGLLRMAHPTVSLDELGRRADPAMTKDAVAGRLRRLFEAADSRAADLGVPDTSHATPDVPARPAAV